MDLHENTMFNMIIWICFLFVFKKALWQTCGFSARKCSRAVNNWCFDDSHTGHQQQRGVRARKLRLGV